MSKKLRIPVGGVCIIILIIVIFQFKIISLENGERKVVYTPPFNSYTPGGSTRADLKEELTSFYGEENTKVEQYDGQWEGDNITVYDESKYDIEYLGKAIGGGHYFSCKALTLRSIKFNDKEKMIETERTARYIGYDDGDLNSVIRSSILWETLKQEYSDSEDYFNSFVIES